MLSFAFPSRILPGFRAWHRWMAERPLAGDAAGFAQYFHCGSSRPAAGFVRTARHTKLIDLRRSEDEIFGEFGKNTRHKLKRVVTEGLRFSTDSSVAELLALYNTFAGAKGLPDAEERVVEAYWPKLVVTKLLRDNLTLVLHSYLLDEDRKYACQAHAAALFRVQEDAETQNLIGRANRYLHYLDMLMLKERGFHTFDIGGYAVGTVNPQLQEVNAFKDSFGGELTPIGNYTSVPLWIVRSLSRLAGR